MPTDNVPQQLIDLVKQFEGCRLQAYPDPISGAEPYTVGYGATGVSTLYGPINESTEWTLSQASADLENRLQGICERIRGFCADIKLTDNQLSALGDFIYNLGWGAFESSFLAKCVLARNFQSAAKQFTLWCHAGGKEIPGLLRRREAEATLFLS